MLSKSLQAGAERCAPAPEEMLGSLTPVRAPSVIAIVEDEVRTASSSYTVIVAVGAVMVSMTVTTAGAAVLERLGYCTEGVLVLPGAK